MDDLKLKPDIRSKKRLNKAEIEKKKNKYVKIQQGRLCFID